MGGFMLIILLIELKSFFFVRKLIHTPTYNFVKTSSAAPKHIQLQNWFLLYLSLHSPIILFSLYVIITGLYEQFIISAAALSGFIIITCSTLSIFTFKAVNYTFKPTKRLIKLPEIPFKKPYWTWPLYYILKEQTLALITCKILSFLLFKGIIWMFADHDNDIRIYLLSLMAATISHCILISIALRFERSYSNFTNSLPLNYGYRLFSLLSFIFTLLIPELFFYSRLSGFTIINTLWGVLLSSGILLTLRMLLYFVDDDAERYLKYIFILLISFTMLIIAGLYIPIILLMLAWGITYHRYLYKKNRI